MPVDAKRRAARAWRVFSNLPPRGKALVLALVALALLVVYGLGSAGVDALRTRARDAATRARDAAENANDAAHEQKVTADLQDANAHETNANAAAVERRVAEANANAADARRAEANANSRRGAERAQRSKDTYEKALNANAASLPDLSDAELCAELLRRGRPCPSN